MCKGMCVDAPMDITEDNLGCHSLGIIHLVHFGGVVCYLFSLLCLTGSFTGLGCVKWAKLTGLQDTGICLIPPG